MTVAPRIDRPPDTVLGRLYLWYLILIPQGATVAGILGYRGPSGGLVNGLLWVAGGAAVGVYAAFVSAFLRMPRVWWRALLAIVDGPLVIAIAAATLHGLRVLDLAAWFFVSESLSLYAAIVILALVSGRPSRDEKLASLGIMAACIAVVAVVCGWSLWGELAASPVDAIVFGVGLVESTAVACAVLTRDVAAREQKAQMAPMIAAMVLWIAACAAGAIARVSMS